MSLELFKWILLGRGNLAGSVVFRAFYKLRDAGVDKDESEVMGDKQPKLRSPLSGS